MPNPRSHRPAATRDQRLEIADCLGEIRDEIRGLVNEGRRLAARAGVHEGHYDAYLWEQLEEHLTKSNRYNTDFSDLIEDITEME